MTALTRSSEALRSSANFGIRKTAVPSCHALCPCMCILPRRAFPLRRLPSEFANLIRARSVARASTFAAACSPSITLLNLTDRLQPIGALTMATHRNHVVAVFNTVKLLEQILTNVNTRTLLLSQRVDHSFGSTITGSTRLQQKLCINPMPPRSKYVKLLGYGQMNKGSIEITSPYRVVGGARQVENIVQIVRIVHLSRVELGAHASTMSASLSSA